MESKKINQLATEMSPAASDLTIIGDPITGVSKKITLEQISYLFGGTVSFYTNYASFPVTGEVDVIYCAKDTKKLYLWSGSAYVEVFPSQALLDTYQLRSEKGNANGYASLDGSGKVPSAQLPSYVDDVIEVANYAALPVTGETGKIYITLDTNKVYRWTGSVYVEIAANNAIWGSITGTLSNQTDLQNALDAKVPTSRTLSINGTSYDLSANRTWSVGTVTSVAVTESSAALSITGSPITTSGTINIGFAGASTDYVAGDGSLVPFPTVVTQAQNLVTEVYNETGATLTKGTVVYINGGHGNLPTITKAIATSDSTSAQTYGVVRTDITNNNNGYVTVIGNIDNIDTQAYAAGTQLYLSSTTAGAWTSTKQYAPAHLVYVGIVTRSHPTQGVVEVRIQNGFEMDELHNVSAQSPSNNDGIFYNTSTSLWEKKSIATVLGFTPISLSSLSATTPLSYNSGTGAFSIQQSSGSQSGYLSSTDWTTFNGKVPYTGATGNVTLGAYKLTATNIDVLGANAAIKASDSGAQLILGVNGLASSLVIGSTGDSNFYGQVYLTPAATPIVGMLKTNSSGKILAATAGTDYVAPSALSGYLPLTGGTLTGALNGTSATFSGNVGIGNSASCPLDVTADNSTAINLRLRGRAADSVGQMEFWNNAQSTRYGYIATDSTAMSIVTTQAIPLILGANSAERMRITSAGNVGIGTSSPNLTTTNRTVLDINGTSTSLIALSNGGTYKSYIFNDGTDITYFATGSTFINSTNATIFKTSSTVEAMRITSGGNVGIGTSSPGERLSIYSSSGNSKMVTISGSNELYTGWDNTDAVAESATNGAYRIRTGSGYTERMRITSGGEWCLGTTAAIGAGLGNIKGNATVFNLLSIQNDASIGNFIYFMNTSGAAAGSITNSGGGVLYLSTSDYRLKQDFKDYNGLDLVSKIKTYDYELKYDSSRMYGVMAHELQEVIPYAVNGEKDGKNMQGVDYSKLVPILIKSIQELEARLKTLENK